MSKIGHVFDQPKTISVNVDIDALRFYHGIHGLSYSPPSSSDPIWSYGVPRFLELFAELNISATFFVVASDLVPQSEGGTVTDLMELGRRRELVHQMIAQKHEVASHSFEHDYALSHRPRPIIDADLKRAQDVLLDVTGLPVSGFRAPGYNLSPTLIDAIAQSGAIYSSSRLPSPPYFGAKWLVMLKGLLTGHPSQSIVGEVAAPFFSRRPYRYPEGLLELPISVIPWLRLPAIGTFFTLYGRHGLRWLLPHLAGETWLNLEFHGIDLLDASDIETGKDLVSHQPDLSTPQDLKRFIFSTWLRYLNKDRINLTLSEAAFFFNGNCYDIPKVS